MYNVSLTVGLRRALSHWRVLSPGPGHLTTMLSRHSPASCSSPRMTSAGCSKFTQVVQIRGDRILDNPLLHLATIVSASFDQNTYVAHLEGRTDCVIIDP